MNKTESKEEKIELPKLKTKKVERLWNMNFVLLWQGQLVSAMGDVIYEIALGFWILAVTGSTALMGTLMATSVLPRIFISPFAGVIVDRSNRKWLLVFMDAIRGISIVLVGIVAFTGFIKIWMVFVAGIIIGTCGSFFNPAVSSSIPDIVPKSKLVNANSAFSMIYTGSGIVSNSAGGFLFQILGAPLMFLLNGISYIFSAFTEIFIKIPKIQQRSEEYHFFSDMKGGFKFIWNVQGLKYLFIIAAVLNFFSNIGFILFLPLFQRTEGLGPGLYGVIMAFLTGGLFLGAFIASIVKFAPSKRFPIFMFCGIITSLCLTIFPIFINIPFMASLVFIGGVANAILNAFISAIMQLTVPQDMRGKVFSLLGSISQALTPIAMALGGVLAEYISIRILISTSFFITILFFMPMFFMPSLRHFVNFDPEKDTLENIASA